MIFDNIGELPNNIVIEVIEANQENYISSSQNMSPTNLPTGWIYNNGIYYVYVADNAYVSLYANAQNLGDNNFKQNEGMTCVVTPELHNTAIVYAIINNNLTYKLSSFPSYAYANSNDTVKLFSTSDNVTTTTYTHMYAGILSTGDSPGALPVKRYVFEGPNINFTSSGIKFDSGIEFFFNFPDGVTHTFQTAIDNMTAGTSKTTKTYKFYLDHVGLKDALAAKADQYTTIQLYHRDGTSW